MFKIPKENRMKYFVVLGSILFSCFCVLVYLAHIKAYQTAQTALDENLLGATTATVMLEGAKVANLKAVDLSGLSSKIDKLEHDINLQLSNLDTRIKALEHKR